jgi:hypothetical protein
MLYIAGSQFDVSHNKTSVSGGCFRLLSVDELLNIILLASLLYYQQHLQGQVR